MKINWFSPLPPQKTDIANYTLRVAPHLLEQADVTFYNNFSDKLPGFPFPCRNWNSLVPRDINSADLNIYHIGNNAHFHASIWQIADRFPGLIVLHDLAVHEMVRGTLLGRSQDDTQESDSDYIRTMQRFYGEAGTKSANLVCSGITPPSVAASEFPLCEAVLEGALAVLTHNPQNSPELERRIPLLPVHDLPLPYAYTSCMPRKPRNREAPLRVIFFGFAAPNRRLQEFIHAWSASSVRRQIQLDICGEIWNPSIIQDTLAETDLTAQTRIHGFVDNATLDRMLDESDLALNLRFPSMGEASGSQLRIWSRGLASMVTDTGWYASLPDATVFKIRPDHEAKDLSDLLVKFVNNPAFGLQVGQAGLQQLSRHDPEKYAKDLIALCSQQLPEWTRRWTGAQMAARVGFEMGNFLRDASLTPAAVSEWFAA